jgi:hypothetical protein
MRGNERFQDLGNADQVPTSELPQFQEFIYGIVGMCFSLITL